jgi:TetR/AcrR family transcriptional regulator
MTINNETRQKILDIAFVLFGKYGLSGVSTADIAREADVNKALIFYYFGSKEDLYKAAFRTIRDRFLRRISILEIPDTSEIEYIKAFVHAHITFLRETPEMVNFLIRELVEANAESSLIMDDLADVFAATFKNLGGVVERGIKNGTIREIDPVQAVISIIGLDVFFFFQKTLTDLMRLDIIPDTARVEASREDHVVELLMKDILTKGNV